MNVFCSRAVRIELNRISSFTGFETKYSIPASLHLFLASSSVLAYIHQNQTVLIIVKLINREVSVSFSVDRKPGLFKDHCQIQPVDCFILYKQFGNRKTGSYSPA